VRGRIYLYSMIEMNEPRVLELTGTSRSGTRRHTILRHAAFQEIFCLCTCWMSETYKTIWSLNSAGHIPHAQFRMEAQELMF
jgi:hypothetical protein